MPFLYHHTFLRSVIKCVLELVCLFALRTSFWIEILYSYFYQYSFNNCMDVCFIVLPYVACERKCLGVFTRDQQVPLGENIECFHVNGEPVRAQFCYYHVIKIFVETYLLHIIFSQIYFFFVEFTFIPISFLNSEFLDDDLKMICTFLPICFLNGKWLICKALS